MSESAPARNAGFACRRCARSLAEADFESGCGIRLLGRTYCVECVERKIYVCEGCRLRIAKADVEAGRVMTLLGKKYCKPCLEGLLLKTHAAPRPPAATQQALHAAGTGDNRIESSPAPTAKTRTPEDFERRESETALRWTDTPSPARGTGIRDGDTCRREGETTARAHETKQKCRRLYPRYAPLHRATLFIWPSGPMGRLTGNILERWIDVSQGGFKAIVRKHLKEGDLIQGHLLIAPDLKSPTFTAAVRHLRPSQSRPGFFVAGCKYVEPDQEFRRFVRHHLCADQMIPL